MSVGSSPSTPVWPRFFTIEDESFRTQPASIPSRVRSFGLQSCQRVFKTTKSIIPSSETTKLKKRGPIQYCRIHRRKHYSVETSSQTLQVRKAVYLQHEGQWPKKGALNQHSVTKVI